VVTFDLLLVGFGHVAQRFVTLLAERGTALARSHGVRVRVVGIATRRHGRVHAARGIDAVPLVARIQRGQPLTSRPDLRPTTAFIRDVVGASRAARAGRFIVIETTTLDIASGRPAIDHVRAALRAGAHVVSANKGPVAFAYRALARAAARANRRFLFEGAVMDGAPVFNLVREALPAVSILGFRGVVNSTTNYILTAMERGQTFAGALRAMQAAGIAEADAALDVEGWDAAVKTAALANVLLGAHLTPLDVERRGISAGTRARVRAARASGRRLKLVVTAERHGDRVRARVAPVALPASDLLAGLEGQQNALILRTDLLGELAIVQRGAGLTQTAYALLSDLLTIARDLNRRPGDRQRRASARAGSDR
jgi:homoserine dehydrogenase